MVSRGRKYKLGQAGCMISSSIVTVLPFKAVQTHFVRGRHAKDLNWRSNWGKIVTFSYCLEKSYRNQANKSCGFGERKDGFSFLPWRGHNRLSFPWPKLLGRKMHKVHQPSRFHLYFVLLDGVDTQTCTVNLINTVEPSPKSSFFHNVTRGRNSPHWNS